MGFYPWRGAVWTCLGRLNLGILTLMTFLLYLFSFILGYCLAEIYKGHSSVDLVFITAAALSGYCYCSYKVIKSNCR